MITELILGAISIVLIIGFSLYVRESNKEKSKLINALIAKTNNDFVNSTLADQTEVKIPQEERVNEVPLENLNDEAWYKAITNSNVDEEADGGSN